ncbi:sporulation protein [Bacillus sp. DNRA2]|uniref:sporulation initiation phosphotransferase B n=1 Tax=Bacillus sp. DNRA2 TaxID=2723053 RepID=UPI00145CF5EB|nr:sporulation initiation phosphotransferase B [Bacillus sp. DNRA2]NMD70559.1 sporulation protein [Bacillus sp. DNRA2]
MKKEWNTVEVMRHARHDWLNKIQLIKGNLDLNKTDRVKQLIEEIVMEAQQEAKLTNLKIPHFATLLMTGNWESYSFIIEYEILNGSEILAINDTQIANWTQTFFTTLHNAVDAFGENHLSITIETQKNGIRFFFDFSGIIKDKDKLQQFLGGDGDVSPSHQVLEFSQQELAIDVFMPFV